MCSYLAQVKVQVKLSLRSFQLSTTPWRRIGGAEHSPTQSIRNLRSGHGADQLSRVQTDFVRSKLRFVIKFLTKESNGPKVIHERMYMLILHLPHTKWNIGLRSSSGVGNPLKMTLPWNISGSGYSENVPQNLRPTLAIQAFEGAYCYLRMWYFGITCFDHPPWSPGYYQNQFLLGSENADSTTEAEKGSILWLLDFMKWI